MKIFVSYRRSDSYDAVVALCDRLGQAFGPHNVFRDEDSIAPGAGFMGSIGGGIYTADLILVVIGPTWLTVADSRGKRRLDAKEDAVRMEVGLALASRRPTVPVLVEGADMPHRRELPRDIRQFASLSAVTLPGGGAFAPAVDGLIARLGGPQCDPTVPGGAGRRPRGSVAWTSFEGRWQTPDGMFHEIVQDGESLELNSAMQGASALYGRGRVVDETAVIEVIDALGNQGRLEVGLSTDGAYLAGRFAGPMGTSPIQLMRRG